MCKDKWDELNLNYKKILDYSKCTNHHISFWDIIVYERDKNFTYLGNSTNNFMKLLKHFKENGSLMHRST